MRISRLTKIFAAAAALVLLAACGSNSGSSSSGSSSGGPVTLTWFMWSGSDVEKNAWLHIADMVTQKYPNIKIQFETTPFNDFWTKLTTEAASGKAPCVIGLQGQRAPQFGNLLVPLDDYMSKAGIKADDFVPSITKGLQYEGKQVALPYDVGPFVMFYNKDAFKAAGLKEPAIGWTTDEFMSDAKALTKAPKYGFWAQSDIGQLLPWVLSSSGKSAVNADGKLDVNNPEWHTSAQWYTDLVSKEKVSAQIPSANSSSASANQFLAGNAYMSTRRSLGPDQRPRTGQVQGRDRSDAGRRERFQDVVRWFRLRSYPRLQDSRRSIQGGQRDGQPGGGDLSGQPRPRLPGPDLHPERLVRRQQNPGRQAGHGRRTGQCDAVHNDPDLAAGRHDLRQAGRGHVQRSGFRRRTPQPDPGTGCFVT